MNPFTVMIGLLAGFTAHHLRGRRLVTLADFAEAGLKACDDTKAILQKVGLYPPEEKAAEIPASMRGRCRVRRRGKCMKRRGKCRKAT